MSEKESERKVSDIAKREEQILSFWRENDIFRKSLEKESPKGEYVFYDGPPFATGTPHHGHILAGTIKDTIPRYRTMRGYHVKRKWGWDCHGLPLENLIEKKLGLATKRDIEALGVEKFNQACADTVMEYADDWKRIVPRLGRWADMEDDYKTMDSSYTESVWWVFAELNRKGLVYEGFKSMHLCPRCGTTLSNFEVNQGYKDIKDIAVTVKLPLLDEEGNVTNTSLLVWTTTPWTLPGNMAAAVHKDYEYVEWEVFDEESGSKERVVFALDAIDRVFHEGFKARLNEDGSMSQDMLLGTSSDKIKTKYHFLRKLKGSELVGKSYLPPFEYYKDLDIENKQNAWKIYHADYVTLESGTGAVHLAPAYGEEDMMLAQKEGIPVVHHVDAEGHFMPFVTDLEGRAVKPKDDPEKKILHTDADVEILKMLKENGRLFAKENIVHSYPHCWRCETPLLNYATSSWFVRVTDIKDKLVEENNKIGWVPEHIGSARFGNWLEGARDWAVSRQRYWGAPLPVWKNKKAGTYKIFGSLEEMEEYVPKSGNTYVLMRHGEAESNAQGVSSTLKTARNPLTEKGKGQIAEVFSTLQEQGVDLIVASPFERTRMSAELIAENLGLSKEQIVLDERLGEIQMGVLDGITMSQYHTFLGDDTEWGSRAPEGGDSWNDVKRRAGACLYDTDARFKNKKILILAHNSPLRMLYAVAKGESLDEKFDHDDEGKRFENAEMRALTFTPLPHNRNFELDYHRPYIDEIELVDTDGEKLVRVPDVFDCWFESGSMPYGQQHYPFEHKATFDPEKGVGFPADFIAESVDQTRGWFYSLIVLGTALFGQSPYKHVITNGLVLAEDGRKMSKSLKNYPDPMDVVDTYGADTLRFYLLSSPIIRGEDLNFSEKNLAELTRKNIGRLANVLSFYELYKDSNVLAEHALQSSHVLDRWILSRLSEVVAEITEGMEHYELDKGTRPLTDFIDDLSVWYVRRSRERLKYGSAEDQMYTLATLRYVLQTLSLVMAPSMPFFAEYLFQVVREESDMVSVHLEKWPEMEGGVDRELLATMLSVRSFVTMGLMLRTQQAINVKQPLQSFTIMHHFESSKYWDECKVLLADELNVKEVIFERRIDLADSEVAFDWTLTLALKEEGEVRELIRHMQDMRKKHGLSPQDTIVLQIDTDSEGQRIVSEHKNNIARTVNASDIRFSTSEGEPLVLESRTYRVTFI